MDEKLTKQEKEEEIKCYNCDCFDFDYGQCTMPSCDRSFACPQEDKK